MLPQKNLKKWIGWLFGLALPVGLILALISSLGNASLHLEASSRAPSSKSRSTTPPK